MNKDLIKTIIIDNQRRVFSGVWSRNIDLPINSGKVITLSGVRRSGKTYMLFNLINQLKAKGIANERLLLFNFDDERLDFTPTELDLILQSYQELYPELNLSDCFFFFDEIQEASDWERFINRIHASVSQNIFVTGSNAKLLSQEISTALRGRTLTYEVYPLSFTEFVRVISPGLNPLASKDQSVLIHLFDIFLHQGGFPELINQAEELKEKILQEYFNVMLFRDLVERYHISNTTALKYFCKRVVGSSADELSVRKIFYELKSLGFKISRDTLYDFQEQIESIYLCLFVTKHDLSVVKSESAQKKCYVIDQGLGSALNYKFSQDNGRLLETTSALELVKQGQRINYEQDSVECDFVITDKSGVIKAIQITQDIADEKTREREIKGLLHCCQKYGLREGIVLTFDQTDELVKDNIKIRILPAWRYFYSP